MYWSGSSLRNYYQPLIPAPPHANPRVSVNTFYTKKWKFSFLSKFHTFLELAVSSYSYLLFHEPLHFLCVINFILYGGVSENFTAALKGVHLQNQSWGGAAFESSQTERLWFVCHRLVGHDTVWLRGGTLLLSVRTSALAFLLDVLSLLPIIPAKWLTHKVLWNI